jgi:nucleoside-diphosphate-sugar epimerase
MTTKHKHDNPILVTGAAGAVGVIGRNLTEFLLERGQGARLGSAWSESLRQAGLPEHLVSHLSAMAELTRQGRYDRMTDTMCKLTGEAPTNMRDFVKLHAAEFKQRGPAHS